MYRTLLFNFCGLRIDSYLYVCWKPCFKPCAGNRFKQARANGTKRCSRCRAWKFCIITQFFSINIFFIQLVVSLAESVHFTCEIMQSILNFFYTYCCVNPRHTVWSLCNWICFLMKLNLLKNITFGMFFLSY